MTRESGILKNFRVEVLHLKRKFLNSEYKFSCKLSVGKETVCPILWSLKIACVCCVLLMIQYL